MSTLLEQIKSKLSSTLASIDSSPPSVPGFPTGSELRVREAPAYNIPLVSAVMAIERWEQTHSAVPALTSFLAQDHLNKHITIIYNPDIPQINIEHPWVRQMVVPTAVSRGQLIQKAINSSIGPWVVLWQPNCWYHPNRISYQLSCQTPGASAVLLRTELRINGRNSTARLLDEPNGVASSLLFERSARLEFPDVSGYEADAAMRSLGNRYVVTPSQQQSKAPCQLNFWYEYNHETVEQFLPGLTDKVGQWYVPADMMSYIEPVLRDHYGAVRKQQKNTEATTQPIMALGALLVEQATEEF